MSAQEPNVPYQGTTGERLKAFTSNAELKDTIAATATKYWEAATYGFLLIAAIILRFYNLGERAMHHDESLHGYFGYGFTKGLEDFFTFGTLNNDGYKHVPFMHGPFQFIASGFIQWIFGDGDYQARILAATMGTAMVIMPVLLRKQLGTIGALAAAAFICFSPTLTYYSRFTREDIYTAFWTLGFVIFAWRYMRDQKNISLYLLAGFMAGLFLTKETSYMTVGAFIFFFNFLTACWFTNKLRAKKPDMPQWQQVGLTVILSLFFPAMWAFIFGWVFFEDFRKRYDMEEMPPEANILVLMASLALPMYAAGIQLVFGETWRNRAEEGLNRHVHPDEFAVAMIAIFGLIGLGAAIGLLWKPKVWAIAAAAFWVPYFLLSTTFFSNMDGVQPDGFFSVIWGSLDYWISQQDVRRGNQPDHYYFITIPVYEFLPLILSLAAGAYYWYRGKARNAMIAGGLVAAILILLALPAGFYIEKVSVVHVILPFTLILIAVLSFGTDNFTKFLMFWLVITAFALTVAGEKMPWLNVHIALPLAILAAKFINDVVERSDLREDLPAFERIAPFFYAAAASGLAVLVFVLVGPTSLASIGGWLLVLVAAAAVYWAYTGYSRKTAMQVAMVGFVAAMAVFSMRATVLASWGHPNNPHTGDVATRDYGEVPIELLVYTQTSGDIPVLVKEIEKAARESGQGENIPIVIDSTDGFTWPWAWYLRDSKFKNVTYTTITELYTPPAGAIVFATRDAAPQVQTGDAYNEGIPYHHRRWFPEEYRGKDGKYTTQDFYSDLFTPSVVFDNWLDYWVRRTPPVVPLGAVDGVAFFPKEFDVSPPPAAETSRTEGTQLIMGGTGTRQAQLSGPSGTFLDGDGNLWVADTNNNRVQKYDGTGAFALAIGGFGSATQLTQPWSLAVADDGTVFIADTWAHRIMKFNSAGEEVGTWGSGGQTDTNADGTVDDDDPMKLFGPRDIALSPDGNVLITDTGNNRVIEYTADGEFVRQYGKKGTSGAPDELNEPVGILVADNGDVYIGDFWNKRILVLDNQLALKSEIAVEEWGSQQVTERAYMVLLDDGRLLVTDPTNGKILTIGGDGSRLGSYDVAAESGAAGVRPIGISTDGTDVLIADSIGNVIRRIPLNEVAK